MWYTMLLKDELLQKLGKLNVARTNLFMQRCFFLFVVWFGFFLVKGISEIGEATCELLKQQ